MLKLAANCARIFAASALIVHEKNDAELLTTTCRRELKTFMVLNGCPGASMSVGVYRISPESGAVQPSQIFSFNSGFADVENMIRFNQHTVSRIASISKCLTSCLLSHLCERKLITWDGQLGDYAESEKVRKSPFAAASIKQLAGHTGGVRSYTGSEFFETRQFKSIEESLDVFLTDAKKCSLPAPYLYSSYGYCLLEYAIDCVAKKAKLGDARSLYQDMLRQIGMYDSTTETHETILPNRARQYRLVAKKGLQNAPFVRNEHKFASGGIMSSADDLQKFGKFILSCSLGKETFLSKESVQLMWKPVSTAKEGVDGYDYCLGWMSKGNLKFHTGGAAGGSSILVIRPFDHGLAIVVVILCNLEEVKRMRFLARKVVDLCEQYWRPRLRSES